jgi:hypothetical protein
MRRCRDTFRDARGLIVPITDEDLLAGLRRRSSGEINPLDEMLQERYRAVAMA